MHLFLFGEKKKKNTLKFFLRLLEEITQRKPSPWGRGGVGGVGGGLLALVNQETWHTSGSETSQKSYTTKVK